MRKAIIVLLVVAITTGILAIPSMAAEPEITPVIAAEPRITTAVANLDITGTTATCSLSASADTTSDTLKCVIRLYRGDTCIAAWSGTGNGYLNISKTKTVTAGYTYKMTVELTINGVNHHVNDLYETI